MREDDPGISSSSSRSLVWNGRFLLTTMSHFLIAWSDDGGRTFTPDYSRRLLPEQSCEAYGIEDARVEQVGGEYLITFTAVGPAGIAVGCRRTRDWRSFSSTELILPPSNKDAVPPAAPAERSRLRQPYLSGRIARFALLGEPPLHRDDPPRLLG